MKVIKQSMCAKCPVRFERTDGWLLWWVDRHMSMMVIKQFNCAKCSVRFERTDGWPL